MVRHADFLDRISHVFGEDHATFKLAYRLIRESGIALEGKRGRHAPERTPGDAAVLWCWLGVTDKPVSAPLALHDFGFSLRVGRPREEEVMRQSLELQDRHCALDALTALIEAEAAGKELPGYVVEFQPDELSVVIDCGFERYRYSREPDEAAAARWAKPYRIIRQFPQPFVRGIAAIFRAE
ncbi:MAG: hypothetical protein EOS23_26425 [Mesorhizobium sp.]|nr:MAG: hypothetical protein EOS23_26425 [Mesorhizobium sp.]